MANILAPQVSGPSFGHRGLHLPFSKRRDAAALTERDSSPYPLPLVSRLKHLGAKHASEGQYNKIQPVQDSQSKSAATKRLDALWDTTTITSSQIDEMIDNLSLSSGTYSGINSALGSAPPSTKSKARSNTLSWPTRKSKSGVALPFGQQPTKYKTDTEIMSARLLQSKKTRITGNAAALSTLNEKAGYRCVAFRLNQNAANPKKWMWHEILDAPILSFESTKGMNTDTETHAFRTQVLHSRERTDVSSNPDYGQFDICFQHILRIDGRVLRVRGSGNL